MSEFYAKKGAIHLYACLYTLQQNGVVERKYQHIMNVVRSLKFQANLPIKFWVDCVLHATYLISILPSPVINNNAHFELLFNKIPQY